VPNRSAGLCGQTVRIGQLVRGAVHGPQSLCRSVAMAGPNGLRPGLRADSREVARSSGRHKVRPRIGADTALSDHAGVIAQRIVATDTTSIQHLRHGAGGHRPTCLTHISVTARPKADPSPSTNAARYNSATAQHLQVAHLIGEPRPNDPTRPTPHVRLSIRVPRVRRHYALFPPRFPVQVWRLK
jgi:hypothetical protein